MPAAVKTVNVACEGMCKWVMGVTHFTDISRNIKQKKGIVAQMDQELGEANKILVEKQSQLKAVVDKVNSLEQEF